MSNTSQYRVIQTYLEGLSFHQLRVLSSKIIAVYLGRAPYYEEDLSLLYCLAHEECRKRSPPPRPKDYGTYAIPRGGLWTECLQLGKQLQGHVGMEDVNKLFLELGM